VLWSFWDGRERLEVVASLKLVGIVGEENYIHVRGGSL
jgi:hypothetical protein